MGALGTLGSLNVLLSADTTTFTSAMEKAAYVADRNFQKISNRGKITVAAITTAAIAASTALAVSVRKAIDQADKLNEMSQAIGLTAEQLSSLEYAAKLSGLSLDDLSTSFRKFNKMIYDGATGSKEAKATFKSLGIALSDNTGHLKNNYDLFLESADALSKMSDGAQKSAVAQELFGKSGANMIPILNEGQTGIKKLADEAAKFGVVISSKTAASADRFNDNMARIASITQGLINSFTSGLIPALADMTDNISGSSAALEKFKIAGESVAAVIITIANTGMTLAQSVSSLIDTISTGFEQLYLLATVQFKAAAKAGDEYAKRQEKSWTDLAATLQKNWDAMSGATQAHDTFQRSAQKTNDTLEKNTETTKRLNKAADGIGQAFGTAFEDAIMEGKKFRDLMMSLLQDIERALLRSLITDQIAGAISSGVSSYFGNPSGGKTGIVEGSAHGNVFSDGNIVPFASGGLITRPSIFPMANGKIGLAGESGDEAIMPLFRGSNGDLGVKAGRSGGVEINVYAPPGSKVSQNQKTKGDMEQINIMIDEAVAGSVNDSGSKTHRALKNSFGLRQTLTPR